MPTTQAQVWREQPAWSEVRVYLASPSAYDVLDDAVLGSLLVSTVEETLSDHGLELVPTSYARFGALVNEAISDGC